MADPIKFGLKFSLKNGNRLNKRNWKNVVAKSLEPNTSLYGVPEIEQIRRSSGAYFCEWHLKKEKEGFIFRERFANTGICGHHPTYRRAIFTAINPRRIEIFLQEKEVDNA